MLIIRDRAYARAGLVGNPSDGYNGKTISFIIRNLYADVILYEWDEIELISSKEDRSRFRAVDDLEQDVKLHGYYGGVRLVKATIKRFVEFCRALGTPLHDRKFSIRYESNIPRQVGLAGSSAIIIATLRCLIKFYGIEVPRDVLPSVALAVEINELGIAAGLQDRVVQSYEGLVYMDFGQDRRQRYQDYEYFSYEPLDPRLLPPAYVAYKADVSQPTEVFHNDIRSRFQQGEPDVVAAMKACAALAEEARSQLISGNVERLAALVNANFEHRRSIYRLPDAHVAMVERARSVGASATFAGSGGAIVGLYHDEHMFARLRETLAELGCVVIKPVIDERRRLGAFR
jgi:glucuronokinase